MGKCKIYDKRPPACRMFPVNAAEIAEFPKCTYWFDEKGNRHGECNPDCGQCCILGMTFDGVYYESCPYRIE